MLLREDTCPSESSTITGRSRNRMALRPGLAGEKQLAQEHLKKRWAALGLRLTTGDLGQLITINEELVGSTGVVRGRPLISLPPVQESITARELLRSFATDREGKWALSTGLFIDPRFSQHLSAESHHRLLRLIGPVYGALFVARLDLDGYVAAVNLEGLDRFRPSLEPRAYLQQVEAGSINEPLLVEYLHHGARPIAIVDTPGFCAAILQWYST